MNWHPCWLTTAVTFVLVSFLLAQPFGHKSKPTPIQVTKTSMLVASAMDTPSVAPVRRSRFLEDTPMIRRNQELIEFPNPAMTNVVALIERYGQAGWLKTGLLEDATLLVCASAQLRLWKSNMAGEHSRLSRAIEKAYPDFPNRKDGASGRENEWKGVEAFYEVAFLDRFRTRYGVTDPAFVSELMRIEFGNPYPDFRVGEPPKR